MLSGAPVYPTVVASTPGCLRRDSAGSQKHPMPKVASLTADRDDGDLVVAMAAGTVDGESLFLFVAVGEKAALRPDDKMKMHANSVGAGVIMKSDAMIWKDMEPIMRLSWGNEDGTTAACSCARVDELC